MRQLSSGLTFIYKILVPTVSIGVFAIVTLLMFTHGDTIKAFGEDYELRWLFLVATILIGALVYWSCIRLKKVTLDGESLRISNYRIEALVPLRDVERVSGSILLNPELVWIHFKRPTEFGRKIVFMGKWRLISGLSRPPVVQELNDLVRRTKAPIEKS